MDYQNIVDELTPVMRDAGKRILSFYEKEYSEAEKEDFPVTEVDLASQEALFEGLKKFPEIPVLSEETKESTEYQGARQFFIIDPLDGTKDFVHKTGDFSVMLALISGKQVDIGMVYKPMSDTLYYAIRGAGAYKLVGDQKEKMAVSPTDDFGEMKLVVSRFHLKDIELNLQEALGIGGRETVGSAGVKMSAIGEGTAHLYINISDRTGEWDSAPGSLIVQESGGAATDIYGDSLEFAKDNPYNLKGFVISTGTQHKKIIETLGKLLEEEKK